MVKNTLLKRGIAFAAKNKAMKEANQLCPVFLFQPEMPDSVKKLRKHENQSKDN